MKAIRGKKYIAPYFLNIGNTSKWHVKFTLRPL